MSFNFFTNCVSCPSNLVNDLSMMVDDSEEITLEQFRESCDPYSLKNILEHLGYCEGALPTIERDWHVKYYKSTFAGNQCVFMVHSAIEYIFLDDRAATYLLS